MTTYRDEHGRFRKRTAEDAQREYEAMPPYLQNMHDVLGQSERWNARALLRPQGRVFFRGAQWEAGPTATPCEFSGDAQLGACSDEQGGLRSLHMNRAAYPLTQTAIGRVSKAINNGIPKPSQTITMASGHTLLPGDVFTIAQGRPVWWRRVLIWLRIIKPTPLRKFVVTDNVSSTAIGVENAHS